MSELSRRAEEVFHRVLEAPTSEREALLRRACSGDEGLRSLVESLIVADREASTCFGHVGSAVGKGLRSLADSVPEHDGPSPLARGERLGEFELVRELGRGGMGVVWEALQTSIGRRVALKVLAPERHWTPRSLARFQREAQAGGRIDHPGIVRVYTIGRERGVDYIAQELVDGARTLAEHLAEVRRLPELPAGYDRETAGLFLEIATALAAAHASGVVHRDVKPTNVLLARSGKPKVADLGLARLEDSPGLSLSGDLLGTPAYMSPEQARGARDVDARGDVFSLGSTLYEALTLRRPFEGDTRGEILGRIERDDPVDPRRLRPRIPLELALICGKALEKRPEDRYASMAAFAEDLHRYLAHEPLAARPPGLVKRARHWARRHPAGATALGLGSLALLGLGGVGALAVWSARVAEARAKDVLRLSTIQTVRRLTSEADALWPVAPGLVPELVRWLGEAAALHASLPAYRRLLEDQRQRSRAGAGDGGGLESQWLEGELAELVRELEAFADPDAGLIEGVSEHGWGVARRLELARTIEDRTVSGPESLAAWKEALASIADPADCPAYRGLVLRPQLGLLPLGRDPASGLWEFAHLLSGEAPERDSRTGELRLTDESAIVLVLLPGGTFWMGAQRDDPKESNHDAEAHPNESPVHRVRLRPFFLAKYEMIQSQWRRCTGTNPSDYQRAVDLGATASLHPVEEVNWYDCERVMRHLGLCLPTEAQWEYAARAGTSTPWWTGAERDSLRGGANLADQSAARFGYDWLAIRAWPELEDGYPLHAPVTALRANPFGLHHVHGNVLEWCADLGVSDSGYVLPTTEAGERIGEEPNPMRAVRGSCFDRDAYSARVSYRIKARAEIQAAAIGLRPARRLE